MFVHKDQSFTIYFGDASHQMTLDEIKTQSFTPALRAAQEQAQTKKLFFLHQVHGVDGLKVVDQSPELFQQDGDFLITQNKNYGIGVATADCLSVVLYDSVTKAIGIAHAGWRGSAAGIITKTIDAMIAAYDIKIENIQAFLGPAAKSCCYEVQPDFYKNFAQYENIDQTFVKIKEKLYFDNGLFACLQLRSLGIKPENIYTKYNVCTICDKTFCSYRRDKQQAGRQLTVIALH